MSLSRVLWFIILHSKAPKDISNVFTQGLQHSKTIYNSMASLDGEQPRNYHTTHGLYSHHPATVHVLPITPEQTIALRHSVLWPEKDMSYVYLPEDAHGLHFGAFLPELDKPVCIISLFIESLPDFDGSITTADDDGKAVRFRKFACDPSYQGRTYNQLSNRIRFDINELVCKGGIGTKLLEHIFSVAASLWEAEFVWCDARATTAEWYEKRGMTTFGTTFFKGGLEYIRMQKPLRENNS